MPTPADLRSSVTSLTVIANADLGTLWREVRASELTEQAKSALLEVLPALIQTYGSAAGAVAADWYDEHRAELGVRGLFVADPVPVGDRGAEALAGWSIGSLFQAEPDYDAALSRVQGGLQRRIADVARETITESSVADPEAQGWQRTGSGECPFCAMLVSRGAVYSEKTADFASHDHCKCSAAPAFSGLPRPVKPYTPSKRKVTDLDRKRVRDYLAAS